MNPTAAYSRLSISNLVGSGESNEIRKDPEASVVAARVSSTFRMTASGIGTRRIDHCSFDACGMLPGAYRRVSGQKTHRRLVTIDLSPAPARIIPARAGNASCFPGRARRPTDHPGACGERGDFQPGRNPFTGSSPRVRGTLEHWLHQLRRERIIPARPGNAAHRGAHRSQPSDHPRACGERVPAIDVPVHNRGSSPRVRGTRRRVHVTTIVHGSSPRVRGTRRHLPRRRFQLRIIPARAGNASARLPRLPPVADHPRACGERWIPAGTRRWIV